MLQKLNFEFEKPIRTLEEYAEMCKQRFTITFDLIDIAEYNNLIDKQTPMEGDRRGREKSKYCDCPRCHEALIGERDKFCGKCGQRVVWIPPIANDEQAEAVEEVEAVEVSDEDLLPL